MNNNISTTASLTTIEKKEEIMDRNITWEDWAMENSSWDPSLALWASSQPQPEQSQSEEIPSNGNNLAELLKAACAE